MSAVTEAGLVHRTHALGMTLGELRRWLDEPHVYPIEPKRRQSLAAHVGDLQAKIHQLQVEPSLFFVVLMGGTGVGKSTLLNSLAGSKIADSGLVRPTTRFPTVYHHRDVPLERLDPVFQKCRMVAHDRPELRFKVLIDTPDVDGNVLEHRERLKEILPVADAVLYVGSQEKYHDREGWSLLLEHRGSRGFAFVLNKWDRCRLGHDGSTGQSPDVDFKHSLAEAGFESPLVFRTCAGAWARARLAGLQQPETPVGDDFLELEEWIEAGLTERAIRDVKVRGIIGKLDHVVSDLAEVIPPDWQPKARELKHEWELALLESVSDHARLLVDAADRSAAAFERHFCRLGRGDFHGIFGTYLKFVERLSRLDLSAMLPIEPGKDSEIAELAARCVAEIPSQARQGQQQSLHDRLLALADRHDWPIESLEPLFPSDQAPSISDQALAETLESQLTELERDFSEPTGGRLAGRLLLKWLCDWLPPLVLVILFCKWAYDSVFSSFWGVSAFLSALVALLLTLFFLHFLLSKFVPVQWGALRGNLLRMIETQLLRRISPKFLGALDSFAEKIAAERTLAISSLDVLRGVRDQLRRACESGSQTALFAKTPRD